MLDSELYARQWFAVYVTPRHEKRVFGLLFEHSIEAVLPLYRTVRQWKKSRPVMLELPLFPCYLFVRVPRASLANVLSLPGVLSIVGSSRGPWALGAAEIEALRLGSQAGALEPHPYLQVGERVRVTTGSMVGSEGILVRKANGFRFVITLEAIMQSVAVEVDARDLELLDQHLDQLQLAGAPRTLVATNGAEQ